jgi:hypothetical protein
MAAIFGRALKCLLAIYAAAIGVQLVAMFVSMMRSPARPSKVPRYATATSLEPPCSRKRYNQNSLEFY